MVGGVLIYRDVYSERVYLSGNGNMKWIIAIIAVVAVLAVSSFAVPTTTLTSKAYASKFDGKPYGAHARTRRAACFNGACRKKK